MINITITEACSIKIAELLAEENNPNLKLRVFVQGGGCSGLQYGFTFEEEQADDDIVIEQNSAKILIDSMSYQYLVGATINYKENIMGSSFDIENPNAQTSCGCGSSFSV